MVQNSPAVRPVSLRRPLSQSNSIWVFFLLCSLLLYISKNSLDTENKPEIYSETEGKQEGGGPLSSDSLDVDRSNAKSNLTHLRQKK